MALEMTGICVTKDLSPTRLLEEFKDAEKGSAMRKLIRSGNYRSPRESSVLLLHSETYPVILAITFCFVLLATMIFTHFVGLPLTWWVFAPAVISVLLRIWEFHRAGTPSPRNRLMLNIYMDHLESRHRVLFAHLELMESNDWFKDRSLVATYADHHAAAMISEEHYENMAKMVMTLDDNGLTGSR